MAPTPEETLALLMDPLIRHPISRHSFAPSHTVAGAVCHCCGQRIVALRDHRCLLCGVAAHRRCLYALSEKCKTDASLKCTSDGSHIPPAEPPSGRLDATSSPAAVLNVAVKQPLDRLWRSATRAADTKPPAAAPAPAPAPVARLREGRGAPVALGSGGAAPAALGPRRRAAAGARAGAGADAPAARRRRRTRRPSRASGRRRGASREESDAGSELRLRVAKAAVGGMAAGAVVGGAVAGPAGAALGAKAAQIVGAGLVLGSPAATGAVVGGALGIHAAATSGGGRGRARRRSTARRGPSAARRPSRSPRRRPPRARRTPRRRGRRARRGAAAATLRDVAGLDAQARAFANFALEADPATAKVWAALDDLYKVRRADARGDAVADARFWARETAIDVEALRFAVADDDGAPIVAATDALVAEATYIPRPFTALVRRRNRDADATLERVLAARGGAGEGAARSVRRGAAALAKIGAGRDAHGKLRALVFCLEALGDSDEGPLVTADVLLPRAVACVAEAKVPHLRAELADALAAPSRATTCYWAPRATR